MKFGIIIIIFFVITTGVQAASLDSEEAASKLIDKVMEKVGSGDLVGGLLLLKPYSVVPESEFNVLLEQTKLQLPVIQGRFGKTLGTEFIAERLVGKSFFQIVHLQKFERHAVRWRFIFYSPSKSWVLDTFTFDDKIHLLFGE
jgi:hypothetical protein